MINFLSLVILCYAAVIKEGQVSGYLVWCNLDAVCAYVLKRCCYSSYVPWKWDEIVLDDWWWNAFCARHSLRATPGGKLFYSIKIFGTLLETGWVGCLGFF